LPGQTLQSWRKSLASVAKHPTILMIFVNEILPLSPAAYDLSYQEKYKFVYSKSERLNPTELYSEPTFFRGNFSESCFSFSKEDFVKMTILNNFYTMICTIKFKLRYCKEVWNVEEIVDKFLQSIFYKRLFKNLSFNWNDDKFYYTINIDNKPKLITATTNYEPGIEWMKCRSFKNFISSCVDSEVLRNEILNYNWKKVGYWDSLSFD
jgi:hypothetical protein